MNRRKKILQGTRNEEIWDTQSSPPENKRMKVNKRNLSSRHVFRLLNDIQPRCSKIASTHIHPITKIRGTIISSNYLQSEKPTNTFIWRATAHWPIQGQHHKQCNTWLFSNNHSQWEPVGSCEHWSDQRNLTSTKTSANSTHRTTLQRTHSRKPKHHDPRRRFTSGPCEPDQGGHVFSKHRLNRPNQSPDRADHKP